MSHLLPRSRGLAALATIGATAALALTACGTESDAPSGDEPASQAECQGPDGDYLIGMSQANNAEPYRVQMNDDIEAAAKEVDQFDVKIADAAQDSATQVSQVQNFITQKVDLLIISPNEAAPLTSVVADAYNQGIPVIVLDRKVEGDAYTQWIGADNEEIGKRAGEFVAKELLPDGGNVVEIRGLSGSTPAKEREDGFAKGIAGNPDIKIIDKGDGDWLLEDGQAEAQAMFKAHDDIDVVYSHNDPMGQGAAAAAEDAGVKDQIDILGIDGLPIPAGGLKSVETGELTATFVYPTGGKEAVDTAKQILIDCEDVPKTVTLETEQVTKENAAQIYEQNSTE
ncbi:substrate-binding domain-containing protein [Solicola gregarius]|uniref:Substrate-binding domain-containing protein n=1 Tax=Solicola gregarius TaxID=2908642 RepID=A0AA46TJC3_9ACTN|nr:substrate-binding domain-containing protein [Solicola gregarius]UYM05914.1 substrate-binding domain-containing protein [Solicola gregarius]